MRLFVVVVFVVGAFAAAQQKKPSANRKFDWSKIYAQNDDKTTKFKRKEEPSFSIKKPNKKWHFIDLEKFREIHLKAAKDEKRKKQLKAELDATYCFLYREEKEATAVVVVTPLQKQDAKIDDVVAEVLRFLLKQKGYGLKLRKFFKRRRARVCRLVYEIGQEPAKRIHERYMFVKRGKLWQLIMNCAPSDYKALEKEFIKLFKSFKF
ncbi:MAG: hypothetical protein DRP63_01520 [Planctomycetota bacterium]|nr:MAG: hypothetical protein DRP63_01520 [Planctomycetota bacterium]